MKNKGFILPLLAAWIGCFVLGTGVGSAINNKKTAPIQKPTTAQSINITK
jgi:hypothetical protein